MGRGGGHPARPAVLQGQQHSLHQVSFPVFFCLFRGTKGNLLQFWKGTRQLFAKMFAFIGDILKLHTDIKIFQSELCLNVSRIEASHFLGITV